MQQVLISKKGIQYLKVCNSADVVAGPPGSSFLLHAHGHCVGVSTTGDGHVILSDPSYPTKQKYTSQAFQAIVSAFLENHTSTRATYFHLAQGSYTPEPVHSDFMLAAGGAPAKRPASVVNMPREAQCSPMTPQGEQVLLTPLTNCLVCGKTLSSRTSALKTQLASVWNGAAWETLHHGSKRCKCGLRYRLSFFWVNGDKTCTLDGIEGDDIYLVANTIGFKMQYLRCHYHRLYRNAVTAQGKAATMLLTAPNFEETSEQYLRKYPTRAFMGYLMLLEGRRGFNVDSPVPDNDPEYGKMNTGFFTIFNAALHDRQIDTRMQSVSVVTDGNMMLGRHMVPDEKPYRKRLAKRPMKTGTAGKGKTCRVPLKHAEQEPAQTQLGGLFAIVSMQQGQNQVLHLGEMLNSECNAYKEQALHETLATWKVDEYCHDCACILEPKLRGKVGRCLVDSWHVKKHKCSKAKFDPKHPKNQKYMKGKNSQAAEQLWSRMNKLHFATHMARANYRAFMRHYCIWRNHYIRAQLRGKHRLDVSSIPSKNAKKQVLKSKSRCGKATKAPKSMKA